MDKSTIITSDSSRPLGSYVLHGIDPDTLSEAVAKMIEEKLGLTQCTGCGQWFPESSLAGDSRNEVESYCKTCDKDMNN